MNESGVTVEEAGVVEPIDVYWRPGCPFCVLLLRGLQRRGVAMALHNIWEDPEAAALVRSVARGYETVPTVIVDGVALVNPSVGEVLGLVGGDTGSRGGVWRARSRRG